MASSVSVVVATYKRPDHLRTCLEHLEAQTLSPQRIIVVDASPDDSTRSVVEDFPNVEYLRNDAGLGTLATSRAIGLQTISDGVVAYIDDDAFAYPDWLERLLEPYSDPTVAAVGGRAQNGQPGEEFDGVDRIGLLLPDGTLTGYFAADPHTVRDVDHMLGANMSYRVEVARRLGGIRDLYPGTCLREDSDMPLRIRRRGGRVVYTPFAIVRHVAGEYPRGRRFDARYRYFAARNHMVLLATALGWRDPRLRRYLVTVTRRAGADIARGVQSAVTRPTLETRARGLLRGFFDAGLAASGTVAGILAASTATRTLARQRR